MCLTAIHPEPKTADKDIVCYKLLLQTSDGNFTSIVRNYPWSIHEPVESKLGPRSLRFDEVEEGLHAYMTLEAAEKSTFCFDRIAKAVVPKGSRYYLGTNDEIAADHMELTKVHRRLYKNHGI